MEEINYTNEGNLMIDDAKGLILQVSEKGTLLTLRYNWRGGRHNSVTWNVLQGTEIVDLKTESKNIIDAINELKSLVDARTYSLFKRVYVNSNSYTFNEFHPDYWHLFVVEFERSNRKLSATLERPAGTLLEYPSYNVAADFAATSSLTVCFTPGTNLVEVKEFGQINQRIINITIYRKSPLS